MHNPSHVRLTHLVSFLESPHFTLAGYSMEDKARHMSLSEEKRKPVVVKRVDIYKSHLLQDLGNLQHAE